MKKFLLALLFCSSANATSFTDYGAFCDGVHDDTAAIQAAVNANIGKQITLPVGTCLISGTIQIEGHIAIKGAWRSASVIKWTDPTLTAFNIKADGSVVIEGINFRGAEHATAGAAITLGGVTKANAHSIIRDCTFIWGHHQIVTTDAYIWTFENNYHHGYANTAVFVMNTRNADSGDSTITKSVFTSDEPNAIAIMQVSSGGLRVINNKFLGGKHAYRMSLAAGAITGILIFQGNSVENQNTSGLSFGTAGGGHFYNVVINGNQFANQPAAINLNDPNYFITRIAITGNSIAMNGSAVCAIVVSNSREFVIAGNQISGVSTNKAICVGSGSMDGRVEGNLYAGMPAPTVSNLSASTVVD